MIEINFEAYLKKSLPEMINLKTFKSFVQYQNSLKSYLKCLILRKHSTNCPQFYTFEH